MERAYFGLVLFANCQTVGSIVLIILSGLNEWTERLIVKNNGIGKYFGLFIWFFWKFSTSYVPFSKMRGKYVPSIGYCYNVL